MLAQCIRSLYFDRYVESFSQIYFTNCSGVACTNKDFFMRSVSIIQPGCNILITVTRIMTFWSISPVDHKRSVNFHIMQFIHLRIHALHALMRSPKFALNGFPRLPAVTCCFRGAPVLPRRWAAVTAQSRSVETPPAGPDDLLRRSAE